MQIDSLTVCITSFRRSFHLRRALESLAVASIRRVAIAAIEPDKEVLKVIEAGRKMSQWLSYDVRVVQEDVGCNQTWLLAAMASRSERVVLLHDDDLLTPAFGEAYEKTIGPAIDAGVGFASWRARVQFDDGKTIGTDYWTGGTREMRSEELLKIVAQRGRLSLSPVISVLDRKTIIAACKESEQCLLHNDCLERPGMLLGTEIVVYMRHIESFPRWLYVNQVLSHYGSHDGSGTVRAEKSGDLKPLTRGYDRARTQSEQPRPRMKPKFLLVHSVYDPSDPDERARIAAARYSWDFLFGQWEFIELPVRPEDLARDARVLGEKAPIPFVRDLFNYAKSFAMPEDIIVYCNADIGLVTHAADRIGEGIRAGHGVTVCPRRVFPTNFSGPPPKRLYKNLLNLRTDGGFDVMAFTVDWWNKHSAQMPDMLLGREAWDTVFRAIAEESHNPQHTGFDFRGEFSPVYTDNVCWHKEHVSPWQKERRTSPGQQHNRALALKFFSSRDNRQMVSQLSDNPIQEVVERPYVNRQPQTVRVRMGGKFVDLTTQH